MEMSVDNFHALVLSACLSRLCLCPVCCSLSSRLLLPVLSRRSAGIAAVHCHIWLFTRVPGVVLRSPDLCSQCFYLPGLLPGLSIILLIE